MKRKNFSVQGCLLDDGRHLFYIRYKGEIYAAFDDSLMSILFTLMSR